MQTRLGPSKLKAGATNETAGQFASYTQTALSVALLSGVSLYLFRAYLGLDVWEYGDETHVFVAAQMITKGHHLYRDVFIQHGPLPVMIAHLYAVVFNRNDFSYLRIAPILLVSASCAAVLLSPVFETWSARICTVAVYISLLSAVWLPKFLNMLLYPSIGGYFTVVLLAQCVMPLYVRGKVHPWNLFVGGASFALAGFAAYQFFLSGLCFILASLVALPAESAVSRRYMKSFVVGAIVVITGVVVWLTMFADVPGYFIYHIYFNQTIYSKFIEFSPISVLNNLYLSLTPQQVVQTVTIALMGGWIIILPKIASNAEPRTSRLGRASSIGLLACGVLFTNPTGDVYEHNNPFLIANFALFAMAIGRLVQRNMTVRSERGFALITMSAAVAVLLMARAGSVAENPFGSTDAVESAARLKPQNDAIYQFVRSITREDGDLLSLEYNPGIYIRAGRLPASGYFFYLPWQAAYNRVAVKGYKIDLCADIRQRRPAAIWFFNWRVWGKYPIEIYEPCVLSHIVGEYAPIGFNSPWHVRKDILERYAAQLPHDSGLEPWIRTALQQSAKVATGPLRLAMTAEHERRTMALRRLGILFASGPSQGDAELALRGLDDATFSAHFALSSITPNRYRYFELPPNVYRVGEIRSTHSNDIRLWEGHFGESSTCMVYEYVDSSRAYTPACPLVDPFSRDTSMSAGVPALR